MVDPEAELELEAVACDQTPVRWLTHSFPASRNLSSFLRNLKERVAYCTSLVDYLLSTKEPPSVEIFWLPGFFSPSSLLALLL